MRFVDADDSHSVSGVRRTGFKEDYRLNWDSIGLHAFLILEGSTESEVSLGAESETAETLKQRIAETGDALIRNGYLSLPEPGIILHSIRFSELKQKGGFEVRGRPGVYAVYGWSTDGGDDTVYVPNAGNIIRLRVDITVEECPVMESKGLFHKHEEYSGYHKVTVPKGVPGIRSNSLYYTVDVNGYLYPFPDEVVAKGGSFYVRCPEGNLLRFYATDKEGIRIR